MPKQPLPEELLQSKLNELSRSLEKSVIFVNEGKITEQEHLTHLENLTPLIEDYKYALRVLKQYK